MTTEEKAAAFDNIAEAMTNQWCDGGWSWWCYSMCGGPRRATQEEAVVDFVAWAKRMSVFMKKKRALVAANVEKLKQDEQSCQSKADTSKADSSLDSSSPEQTVNPADPRLGTSS